MVLDTSELKQNLYLKKREEKGELAYSMYSTLTCNQFVLCIYMWMDSLINFMKMGMASVWFILSLSSFFFHLLKYMHNYIIILK